MTQAISTTETFGTKINVADSDQTESTGFNIEIIKVENPPPRVGEDPYVLFHIVHSEDGRKEVLTIPLKNTTPTVMLKLRRLVGTRLDKPKRNILPFPNTLGGCFLHLVPYEALMMLAMNRMQRGLHLSAVERYAQYHKEKRWLYVNQGIGIDINGMLLDGQHRLFTVVLMGEPMPLLVVWGLDPEARSVVDGGVARSPGQVDDMMGGHTEDLPSGTVIQQYTTKTYLLHGGTTNKASLYYKSIKNLYLDDLAWLNQYICHRPKYEVAKKKMLSSAAVATAFLLLHHARPTETEKFAEAVFQQDNPDQNKAVRVLCDYLTDRGNDDMVNVTHKILTAAFAYFNDQEIKLLRGAIACPKNYKGNLSNHEYRRNQLYRLLAELWGKQALLPEDAFNTLPDNNLIKADFATCFLAKKN